MKQYRILQKGGTFIVQSAYELPFGIKLWFTNTIEIIFSKRSIEPHTILFATQENALRFIGMLTNWPKSVKYKGFLFRRCWPLHSAFHKTPPLYYRVENGTKYYNYTTYYASTLEECKKRIDDDIARKKYNAIRKIIYP